MENTFSDIISDYETKLDNLTAELSSKLNALCTTEKDRCDIINMLSKRYSSVKRETIFNINPLSSQTRTVVSTGGTTGVKIMLDYGDKSHVIYGDTKPIKDKIMSLNRSNERALVRFNARLDVGPGWVIMDKSRIDEVYKMLNENGIKYEIDNKMKGTEDAGRDPPPKVATSASSPKGKAAKTTAKIAGGTAGKKTPPEPALSKRTAKVNNWGNLEDETTGIVFMKLPIGIGGKMTAVAIGVQNRDCPINKKGLSSVKRLDDESTNICRERSWRILDDDILDSFRDYSSDNELFNELNSLVM